jgi:hypothetical protein
MTVAAAPVDRAISRLVAMMAEISSLRIEITSFAAQTGAANGLRERRRRSQLASPVAARAG